MFGCDKGLANRKTNPDTLIPLSLDGTISAVYFPTLKAAYATYYRRLFAYLRRTMVKYALVDVRAGKYVGLELLNLTNLTVPFEEKNTRSAPGGFPTGECALSPTPPAGWKPRPRPRSPTREATKPKARPRAPKKTKSAPPRVHSGLAC